MHSFSYHQPHHASYHLRQASGLRRLFVAHCFIHVVNVFIFVFIPLNLYQNGYSITELIGLYFAVGLFKLLFVPLGFYLISKLGANRVMILGAIAFIATFALLVTLPTYHWPLFLIAACKAANSVFYYSGFELNFALNRPKKQTSQSVSRINIAVLLLGVVAPAISGFTATVYGIHWLYLGGIALVIVACFILLTDGAGARQKLSYQLHWQRFKGDYIANVAVHISGLTDVFAWTLLVFLIIPTYIGIGLLGSLSVLTLLILTWFLGRKGDEIGEKPFIKAGSLVSALVGILRLLAQTPLHIMGINFLKDVGSTFLANSYISRFYRNSDGIDRMGYMFGMFLANAVSWIGFFGLLLVASLFLSPVQVLLFGVLLGIPAAFLMRLMR